MSNDEAQVTPAQVMDLIQEEDPTLYCDRGGRSRVVIPKDSLSRAWPIDSPRTRGWIAAICHDEGLYPSSSVMRQVLTIMEGIAWSNIQNCDDSGVLAVFEAEPVVEALENLMSDRDTYEKSAKDLLNELETENDRQRRHTRWPKSASALTRRLRERRDILDELGLSVTTQHRSMGTVVRITKSQPFGDGNTVMPQ
ncbi:MAG: hypothetical protein RJP95_00265 [Pirellulales bacterium]